MSASGTSRHFAAAQQFGRIWSEADINHGSGFMGTRFSFVELQAAAVVIPPVPRSVVGPDGTVQVVSPVLGGSSIMNGGGKLRRGY